MAGDYPEGRGRVTVHAAGLEIEGVSIAGHESFYKVPAFRCLLEFGRAPDDVLGYGTVCLTHGHLDHPAARLSRRLRARDLRRGAGALPRARAVDRVLVPGSGRPRAREKVRPHPPGRHCGARLALPERSDRADALLDAVPAGGDFSGTP